MVRAMLSEESDVEGVAGMVIHRPSPRGTVWSGFAFGGATRGRSST